MPKRSPKRRLRTLPGVVCKPCWELQYCPYGSLVEYFPIPGPESRSHTKSRARAHAMALNDFLTGNIRDENDVFDTFQILMYNHPEHAAVIAGYDPDDVGCRFFGHACPVFFLQNSATETRAPRRRGRYIPREIMRKRPAGDVLIHGRAAAHSAGSSSSMRPLGWSAMRGRMSARYSKGLIARASQVATRE